MNEHNKEHHQTVKDTAHTLRNHITLFVLPAVCVHVCVRAGVRLLIGEIGALPGQKSRRCMRIHARCIRHVPRDRVRYRCSFCSESYARFETNFNRCATHTCAPDVLASECIPWKMMP